jgi:regulator of replication initiation timing
MFQYRIDELTEENDKLSSEIEALRQLLDEHGISYPEKKE